MILVDSNLLIYAHATTSPHHDRARDWLDRTLNGPTAVGMPWASLLAFVRLVSNPRVYERAEPLLDSWAQVEEWLAHPRVWIPEPTERHGEVLGGLIRGGINQARLVPDAHLAALAIEHGLTLCSADGDFARFPGLKWENPLAG